MLRLPCRCIRALGGAVLLALLVAGLPAAASPRLIVDNRVRYVAGVPSLGRGYNMRDNALQSLCFQDVQGSAPSFDFHYDIEQIDGHYLEKLTASADSRIKGAHVVAFIRDHLGEVPVHVEGEPQIPEEGDKRTLIVHLSVDTYHYALDEAQSPLTDASRQLLTNSRYVTFFSSCGYFYVRSIRTFSSYMALLQFTSTGDAHEDGDFIAELEKGLLSFGDIAAKHVHDAEKLSAKSSERDLKVFVRAYGLSKQGEPANLVPVSVEQFRSTIQDAASMMQEPKAGVVTSIEVAPWTDNPEVGAILSQANGGGAEEFRRLHNLENNSQVITAINEHRHFLLNEFYFASLCKRMLFERYPTADILEETRGARVFDPVETKFYNQSNEADRSLYLALGNFVAHFKEHDPVQLLQRSIDYMQGSPEQPGAYACIEALYDKGIESAEFTQIPACLTALEAERRSDQFLAEYCLPKPARLVAVLGE